MLRKLLVAVVWFPLTFALLTANLSLLITLSKSDGVNNQSYTLSSPLNIMATSYGTEQVLGAQIKPGDARSLLLTAFLKRHESPIAEYANYIVDRAEHYGIDYRLVSAIAMCESNVGKRMPTKASHNAWGISVETGETSGAAFPNWIYAIDWVSRYLKEKYYDRGITNLINIGAIYAPPSVANGNSWANCVSHFMDEIQ